MRTHKYALAVLNGERKAGKAVIKQARKHLRDLRRSADDDFPYYFDEAEAQSAIAFAECLKFTDGDNAGETITLADFQAFIIGCLFGWKLKATGKRRFKKAYIQLARKQAKTYLVCMIALYMAEFCGFERAQVYTTATAAKQAKIAFNNISNFISKDNELKKRVKSISEREMTVKFESGSTIQSLSGNTGSIDGFQPFLGIVDEYHAHTSAQMVKLLEDGQVQLAEPLLLIITTAGFNVNGSCYNEYKYAKRVIDEEFENDRYFAFIAELDEEDDEFEAENWYKACPLAYYRPEIITNLQDFADEVKNKNAEDLLNFRVKNINKWVEKAVFKFLNASHVEQARTVETLANYRGAEVVIGVDLSEGGDLTSVVTVILHNGQYFLHHQSFMPAGVVEERTATDKTPYLIHAQNGHLTLTNSVSSVDYEEVRRYINEHIQAYEFEPLAICFDPYRFAQLRIELEKDGFNLVEVRQTMQNLTEPTFFFRSQLDEGRVTFNESDELMRWSFINAEIVNRYGYVKIDKAKRFNRIDVADATINAFKFICSADLSAPANFNEELISALYM